MPTKSEINGRICACKQEIAESDYARLQIGVEALKCVKELAQRLNLPLETPVYDKYTEKENNAAARRAEINELEAQYESAEDDLNI